MKKYTIFLAMLIFLTTGCNTNGSLSSGQDTSLFQESTGNDNPTEDPDKT